MEVNSQFHMLVDLPLELTEQEAGWAPQRLWML